jgi:hypothetical protein
MQPTGQPSSDPSRQPSCQPSCQPSKQPSTQPTSQPSYQPSLQPSCQPSKQPTRQPTSQPTSFPSSQPTIQPSNQPTTKPTTQPSCQPSKNPSMQPSSQPSNQPSIQPSSQPSSEPSSQPTLQPSKQPICSPSSQPSVIPTGQPSTSPTVQPSSLPSYQPSSIPSMKPSSIPTSFPSIKPTMKPSGQPSSNPSSNPSSIPSAKPSLIPSSQPTSIPSSIPSRKPTSIPSSQPSSQPSIKPTSLPTLLPSSQPSVSPTSKPSHKPTVSPTRNPTYAFGDPTYSPTPSPTLAPTTITLQVVNHYNEIKNSIIQESLIKSKTDSILYYSEVFIEDTKYLGGCENWKSFTSGELSFKSTEQKVNEINIYFSAVSDNIDITSITCADNLYSKLYGASKIIELLVNGNNYYNNIRINCSETKDKDSNINTWILNSCNSVQSMSPLSVEMNQNNNDIYSVSSCSSTCNSNSLSRKLDINHNGNNIGYSRILEIKFLELQPAPLIKEIKNIITNDKKSLLLSIKLESDSRVYCNAYENNKTFPTNIQDFTEIYSNWTSNNTTHITINSLIPSTIYKIYCVAVSLNLITSLFQHVEDKSIIVSTPCCKSININVLSNNLYINEINLKFLEVNIEGLPSSSLEIIFELVEVNDLSNRRLVSNNSYSNMFSPSKYMMNSNSGINILNSYVAFTGLSRSGEYYINISLSYTASLEFQINFNSEATLKIMEKSEIPPSPKFKTVKFSNDGLYLIVLFNSPTNRGNIDDVITNIFRCSDLFIFIGVDNSNCQWINDFQINIYPSSQILNIINIGDIITLKNNTLKSKCQIDSCETWPFIESVAQLIQEPTLVINPIVVVSSPSIIGSCDSLTINLMSSIYRGRLSKLLFIVNSIAPNTTFIEDFLNNDYINDPPTPITSELLLPGYSYLFTVLMCNFLGGCSSSTKKVIVLNSVTPTITIYGGSNREVYRNSKLIINSLGTVSNCEGRITSNDLMYSWEISLNGIEMNNLSSESRNPSKFMLSPYILLPDKSYEIKCIVTSLTSYQSSNSIIMVKVILSDLYAIIKGGDIQSIKLNSEFSLDATQSYDSNQIDYGNEGITYEWSCITISPIYKNDCNIFMNSNTITNSILFANTNSYKSINSTCTFTLNIYHGDRFATASTNIIVTSIDSPSTSITYPYNNNINVNTKLQVLGNVQLSNPGVAKWSLSDNSLVFNNILLNPTSLYQNFITDLFIKSNTLPQRSTFTLTLLCESYGLTSYSSIIISTNGSPLPGRFDISPLEGYELNTRFAFTASSWSDENLPLSYQFSYYSPKSNQLVLKAKSELAYGNMVIPAGLPSNGYEISCGLHVFDSLNANITQDMFIFVYARKENLTFLYDYMTEGLAISKGNNDLAMQTIYSINSVLNVVNCTNAPNCSSLNRYECSSIDHTCGKCLDGDYVGSEGYSNSKCISSKEYSLISNGQCSGDQDCPESSTCDLDTNYCLKECDKTCSGNGNCIFINVNTLIIQSKCLIRDSKCASQCQCINNYYGDVCDASNEIYLAKQAIRENLLTSLLIISDTQDTEDSNAISSHISTISELTIYPKELNDNAGDIAIDLTKRVVSSTDQLESESTVLIISVIDTLTTWGSDPTERNVSANFSSSLDYLLGNLGMFLN